jgi:hypothetical protein
VIEDRGEWADGTPLTVLESVIIHSLRLYGCECDAPLLGQRGDGDTLSAVRCRLCNAEYPCSNHGLAFLVALESKRRNPNTPRCALWHCKKPAMVLRQFDIDGEERWLSICEDCEDGLLWSSNGYIKNIRKICKGYDLRTGERRDTLLGPGDR